MSELEHNWQQPGKRRLTGTLSLHWRKPLRPAEPGNDDGPVEGDARA